MKRMSVLAAAAALAVSVMSAQADENKIVIDGSTTVGPIAKAFAEYYMSLNPDVNVTVSESGSGNGAKGLVNSTCDIGAMSRFMKDKEYTAACDAGVKPVPHVVALDGLAIVLHPGNPIGELTVEQIRDIYLGKITNWKEIGGPDSEIVVISRDTNSGTYETFEGLVMNKEKMAEGVEYVGSNGQARQRVMNTPSAIAYLGLGFVDDTVKPVKVNGVAATVRSIASGEYPIARPLYMFTNGYPKLGSHLFRFITIYLTEKGQEIVEEIGFIPVTQY